MEIYTSGTNRYESITELVNPEHTTALLDTLVEKATCKAYG